jgi:hypothetical protein
MGVFCANKKGWYLPNACLLIHGWQAIVEQAI